MAVERNLAAMLEIVAAWLPKNQVLAKKTLEVQEEERARHSSAAERMEQCDRKTVATPALGIRPERSHSKAQRDL